MIRYVDAEEYEKIYRKIKIEELFVDFVNLSCYLGYYTTEEKIQRIDDFEANCAKYGTKYLGSGKDLASLVASLRENI